MSPPHPDALTVATELCTENSFRARSMLRHARHVPLSVALLCSLTATGCGDRTATAASKAPEPEKVAVAATGWPMTRGGPALSGNVAARLPVSPITAWTFKAATGITGEPAISANRVYVGTLDGILHCLSADAGQESWQFATKETISAAPRSTHLH